ncbi:hypothetical protein RhiirC2_779440 [Rhizophagus irregularis]|uniref:Uncharacterized protein n=1 Tax=Rhizophagus irregularis TaxID=588596 RepID=A0A2N1NA11_9GLOM|nr:hypothetical protein RhiirC2_779440 [Rhizophagus irregularis]
MSPRNEQIQRNYSRRALRTSRFVNQNQNQNRNSQIINSNTIDRIARITTPQITDNLFANDLFNGTNFHNDSNPESLILPSGSSVHSPSEQGIKTNQKKEEKNKSTLLITTYDNQTAIETAPHWC